MKPIVATRSLAFLAVFVLITAHASAQGPYREGTRVEASPTMMEGYWQDCVVVSGPDKDQWYKVRCGQGSALSVPARWIRPSAAAPAKPAASTPVPARPTASTPPATGSAGSPGPTTARPKAPAAPPSNGAASAVALGTYECWAFNSPRMNLNFEVTGPGRYKATDGSAGTFTFEPGSKAIRFTGYLAEAMPTGFTSIYYEPNGHPTVSFRGRGGAEASFCEKAK